MIQFIKDLFFGLRGKSKINSHKSTSSDKIRLNNQEESIKIKKDVLIFSEEELNEFNNTKLKKK